MENIAPATSICEQVKTDEGKLALGHSNRYLTRNTGTNWGGNDMFTERFGSRQGSKHRVIAGSIAVCLALGLAACSSTSGSSSSTTGSKNAASSTKSPVVFHVILSETGGASFLGQTEKKSLSVFEKYINETGGIQGHPIQMDIVDNQTNPQVAVSLATPWMSGSIPFILNGSIGETDKAVDALSTTSGPFVYDLSPVEHPPANSMIFSSGFSLLSEIQADLTFFKDHGWKNIAALTSTDSSGQAGYAALTQALGEPQFSSLHLITHQVFGDTDVSVTSQLSVIKADHPQAMITWTTGTPLGTVLKGMSDLNMESLPTTADSGNGSFSEMESFGSIVPKDLYIAAGALTIPAAQLPQGAVRTQVAALQEAVHKAGLHPQGIALGLGWANAWDPAYLVTKALRKIGPEANAHQILSYLEHLHGVAGTIGIYNTSPTNHRGLTTQDVYELSWNGKTFVAVSTAGGSPKP